MSLVGRVGGVLDLSYTLMNLNARRVECLTNLNIWIQLREFQLHDVFEFHVEG